MVKEVLVLSMTDEKENTVSFTIPNIKAAEEITGAQCKKIFEALKPVLLVKIPLKALKEVKIVTTTETTPSLV